MLSSSTIKLSKTAMLPRVAKRTLPVALVAIVGLGLSGCATDNTGVPGALCGDWQPIHYSRSQDSKQTQDEASGNNARRFAYCKD